MCGTSRWKAAKSASKTMKNLDETGIVVSCCRHQIAQKALNIMLEEKCSQLCVYMTLVYRDEPILLFSRSFFFPAILLFSTYFSEYFAQNLCVLLKGSKHVCSYM